MLKRRSFITYFSISWLTSSLPMILAVCNPRRATAQTTTNDNTLAIADRDSAKSATKKKADGFTTIGSLKLLIREDLSIDTFLGHLEKTQISNKPSRTPILYKLHPVGDPKDRSGVFLHRQNQK